MQNAWAFAIAIFAVVLALAVVIAAGVCVIFGVLLVERVVRGARPPQAPAPVPQPARAAVRTGTRGGRPAGRPERRPPPEAGGRAALDRWRYDQLVALGLDPVTALEAARTDLDVPAFRRLASRGCPPGVALDILRPDEPA